MKLFSVFKEVSKSNARLAATSGAYRSRVPLKPVRRSRECCKLSKRGPGGEPRPKTNLMHSMWESHWWQSFGVFWSACFTVVTYQEYRDGVGPSPKAGTGAGSAPSKSANDYAVTSRSKIDVVGLSPVILSMVAIFVYLFIIFTRARVSGFVTDWSCRIG